MRLVRPRRPGKPRPPGRRRRQLSRAANRSKLRLRGLRQNRRPALLRNPRSIRRNIQRSTQTNMSTISHDQDAKRFTTEVDGQHAELDYLVADGVMTITHTRVPREIGGRGIAAELMRAALQVAAERGLAVDPACSYAAAYMRKHGQTSDKVHMDELLDEALEESFPASDSPAVGGAN
jgi:predicted GNAT family acetyltransferase